MGAGVSTRGRRRVRVAAAQFAVGPDVDANLRACLHWIGEAGKCRPDLIVLPEFLNHVSWYDDAGHCQRVSISLSGPFVAALAAAAREVRAHVVANSTVAHADGRCTGTSLLFSPEGTLLATSDKQVLIGHENDFLQRARQSSPIVYTPIGRLGLYACMDGVVSETPRCLALRGAQILCNSLNSFASDEGSLHIPVRAAENRVFIVAANKVGPLIPEAILEPVSQATGIPARFLHGAGESQIVAPDGTVLAIASADREEVIWADIDVSLADAKLRPDGTSVFTARRPELYGAVAADPATQPEPECRGAEQVPVAAVQLPGVGQGAVDAALEMTREAAQAGARFVVLPELFFLDAERMQDRDRWAAQTQEVVEQMRAVCGDTLVALSGVERTAAGHGLVALVIDRSGVRLRQPLLHHSQRHGWSGLGDRIESLQLADAHIAVLAGDDALYPEIGRLLAMRGVNLLLVPCAPLEAWELRTGLVERAAENRINLVAACQPGALGTSLIAALQKDFTLMTPWAERAFDGLLSQPMLTRAGPAPGITHSTVHPAFAANKIVSRGTDLVRGRAWWLAAPITARLPETPSPVPVPQ